jgi:cytidylate kinase
LADLADLKILVDVPVEIRHRRLMEREERAFLAKWHATWDGAEQFYFQHIQDASTFDMVVENS